MVRLPRIFAALSLYEEAAQQYGRAEALLAVTDAMGTEEEKARATHERGLWLERLTTRRSMVLNEIRQDYM